MTYITEVEHEKFPKLPRLNRQWLITEKIDGTNAAVGVTEAGDIYAQSRNRVIAPGDDGFGFAAWVMENEESLKEALGPGLHFGEWYGSGIQRGYGMQKGEKKFALFNVSRWCHDEPSPWSPKPQLAYVEGLTVVPVIGCMPLKFDSTFVEATLETLRVHGSYADGANGFGDPEGIVLYSAAANQAFKVTLKNDEKPKGSNEPG